MQPASPSSSIFVELAKVQAIVAQQLGKAWSKGAPVGGTEKNEKITAWKQ